MTGIGVVKPFKYPSMPPALILLEVIIMNTTTAQAASCGKISCRLLRPVRLIRLETTLVVKQSCHKWDQVIKLCSAGIISHKLLCLFYQHLGHCLPFGYVSTFRSLVSQIHSPVISIITIQLTTSVSDIRKSPRIGMPVGDPEINAAPEILKFISAFSSPFL